jgi:hypothetical protein
MTDFGLKVSKPGQNVLTAGDDKLIFSSKLSEHPVYLNFAVTFSGTSYTYTHNLGYYPKVWVNHVNAVGGVADRRLPYTDTSMSNYDYYITPTTVVITKDNAASQTFRIIIFAKECSL